MLNKEIIESLDNLIKLDLNDNCGIYLPDNILEPHRSIFAKKSKKLEKRIKSHFLKYSFSNDDYEWFINDFMAMESEKKIRAFHVSELKRIINSNFKNANNKLKEYFRISGWWINSHDLKALLPLFTNDLFASDNEMRMSDFLYFLDKININAAFNEFTIYEKKIVEDLLYIIWSAFMYDKGNDPIPMIIVELVINSDMNIKKFIKLINNPKAFGAIMIKADFYLEFCYSIFHEYFAHESVKEILKYRLIEKDTEHNKSLSNIINNQSLKSIIPEKKINFFNVHDAKIVQENLIEMKKYLDENNYDKTYYFYLCLIEKIFNLEEIIGLVSTPLEQLLPPKEPIADSLLTRLKKWLSK